MTNLLLTNIKNSPFYHGSCALQGHMGNIIYFEDIDVAGMTATMCAPRTGRIEYTRFTCQVIETDKDAVAVPGNKTVN